MAGFTDGKDGGLDSEFNGRMVDLLVRLFCLSRGMNPVLMFV